MLAIPYKERFLHAYPDALKPDRIAGGCAVMAHLYADMGRRSGVGIVYLLGHRLRYPRRHPLWSCYPNPDPEFYHVVNFWRGLYVDWSYRQFDPLAPVPFVAGTADMRRMWRLISINDPTD